MNGMTVPNQSSKLKPDKFTGKKQQQEEKGHWRMLTLIRFNSFPFLPDLIIISLLRSLIFILIAVSPTEFRQEFFQICKPYIHGSEQSPLGLELVGTMDGRSSMGG